MDASTTIPQVHDATKCAHATTFVLVLLLGVFFLASFLLGPSNLPMGDLLAGLLSGHGAAGVIARELRLPRAALALVIGAALGASGAALQGLFRNPLAEPGVTGVTSSAGRAALVAISSALPAAIAFR